MENARGADSAITAYREEVAKTIAAYREEVRGIVQVLERSSHGLSTLSPGARDSVISAICNGRTFSRSWSAMPKDQRRVYIQELKAVLVEAESESGGLKIRDEAASS